MEMDLSKLRPDDLPDGESQFLAEVIRSGSAAYGAGFMAEWVTLAKMAVHFRCLAEWDNVALVRIGSGGRFEGAALGEAEFVLLTTAPIEHSFPPEEFDRLIRIVGSPLMGVGMVPNVEVRVEHKRLDSADRLSYYPGTPTPYPGRILEGEWVAGNRRLLEEARRRVFAEIIQDDRIVAGMRVAAQVHAGICESGISRKIPQFDLASNTIFYDPAGKQFGLKYGILRFIQTALSIEIFDLIRRRNVPIDEIVDLNQSVEERVRYLLRKNWVAKQGELIDAGLAYVQACDLQSEMKIHYYSKDAKKFQLSEGSLLELNRRALSAFQQRLLVD